MVLVFGRGWGGDKVWKHICIHLNVFKLLLPAACSDRPPGHRCRYVEEEYEITLKMAAEEGRAVRVGGSDLFHLPWLRLAWQTPATDGRGRHCCCVPTQQHGLSACCFLLPLSLDRKRRKHANTRWLCKSREDTRGELVPVFIVSHAENMTLWVCVCTQRWVAEWKEFSKQLQTRKSPMWEIPAGSLEPFGFI